MGEYTAGMCGGVPNLYWSAGIEPRHKISWANNRKNGESF